MLPARVDIVIVGGGVAGLWNAYHLLKHGRRPLVLEQQPFLGAGSTSRSAGGIRRVFACETDVRLALESLALYQEMARESGEDVGFRQDGYLFLAQGEARVRWLEEAVRLQARHALPALWFEPPAVARRWPYLAGDDLAGALFSPADGYLDPHAAVHGLAAVVRRMGGSIMPSCQVVSLLRQGAAVAGVVVRTRDGQTEEILADAVVNAAGPWAGRVAALAGLTLSLSPCRRQIFVTAPCSSLPARTPLVIDEEAKFYFRREGQGLLLSAMEVEPTAEPEEDPPADWRTIEVLAERAFHRVPCLGDLAILRGWAGYRTLTPDERPVLGPAPGRPGLWLAVGFGGSGITQAPGAGRMLARLMSDLPVEEGLVAAYSPARFCEDVA